MTSTETTATATQADYSRGYDAAVGVLALLATQGRTTDELLAIASRNIVPARVRCDDPFENGSSDAMAHYVGNVRHERAQAARRARFARR